MKHIFQKTILGILLVLLLVGMGWVTSFRNLFLTGFDLRVAEAQEYTVTITLQNGLVVNGDMYSGVEDVSIGTRSSHYGGISVENGWHHQRALLRFDLSPIPPSQVLSAKLSLYVKSYPGLTDKSAGRIELSIHKVTQGGWDDHKANWNSYDGVNSWVAPGMAQGRDFETTPVSTFIINTVDSFQNLWVIFDVTPLIQEYVNSGIEPNPGMFLKAQTKLYPVLSFIHSESSDEISLRPKLEITYVTESPLAVAGENQGLPFGESAILDATKSFDPNETSKNLIYQWRFVSKPNSSNLTDNDIVPNNTTGTNGGDMPRFTPDTEGDYIIELTVINSKGLSDKDWLTVNCLQINPHPRIWLTPEVLANLKAKAAANTPEWVSFKRIVDSYLDNNSNPYYEAGYLYTYALAYLVTGDERYAARALNIMNENIYTYEFSGHPGYRACYWARDHGTLLAVGYDWLYNYLSEADKVRFYEKMNEWAANYFYTPGIDWDWARNNPHNNFFYGRVIAGGLAGIATYGDNPRAKEWLDHVRDDRYTSLVKPVLTTHYKNGGWLYEGIGYSEASYEFLFEYFLGLKTAGIENLFRDTAFSQAVIYNIIYNTQPNLKYILPTGDTNDSASPAPPVVINDYTRTLMLILAEEFKGSVSGQYAQWYLNHNLARRDMQRTYNRWRDFLWYTGSSEEKNIAELSLDYFDGDGTGFVYGRSDWSESATWVAFQSGGDTQWHDHQHHDQNSFYIFKKSWLAAPGGYYGVGDTINYNTIVVNNGTKDVGQDSDWRKGPGIIQRFEKNREYIYTQGQSADVYNSIRNTSLNLLDNYVRQLVYIKPDYVIVFDRIRTVNFAYYPKWLLHFVNEPIISGNLTTAVNGEGKIFVKTLSPANYSLNKIQGQYDWKIELADNDKSDQDYSFLHVLQVSDVTTNAMVDTEWIGSVTENMVGAKIVDIIVLFSRTETKDTGGINEPITYTVSGTGTSKHLIVDLKPNTQFTITNTNLDTGQKVSEETKASSTQGTLYFETMLGSRHEISITPGGQIPVVRGDVNEDGLVNVVDVQLAVNQFLGVAPQTQEADLNGDGVVNVIDVQGIVNIFLGG